MAVGSYHLRRECTSDSNSPDCEKPVSQTLINAVPAAILGGVVVISAIVLFIIVRRKRRQEQLEDDKDRDFIEIDDYGPATAAGRPQNPPQRPIYPEPSYQRDSELSLSSATPTRRVLSPSTTTFDDAEFNKGPYGPSLPPTPNNKASRSTEDLGRVSRSERALV
ncbi:hypothetical protein VTN96DRAFT_8474 [Rasamsonia emersonii]|uniref:Uncharacterized protein n=1 Tax=Rasamsonia emersonii (strain ATCC 16479 / CBS 393.64 / IMI 116815) TaxID=1408163 RepID=A0A0F4Z3Z6_RASE3|nr:hypothetical protein T310_0730 [Rasamsonia emersonii CBS 393.64]KKA25234.1 hypothetical protein T310_0730 [Rasamsonia emersonii CBS 393.64]